MGTYRGRALLVTDDDAIAAVVHVVLHPVSDPTAGSTWTGSAQSFAANWTHLFDIGEMTLRVGERDSRCRVAQPQEADAQVDATLSGLDPPPFD